MALKKDADLIRGVGDRETFQKMELNIKMGPISSHCRGIYSYGGIYSFLAHKDA